MFSRIRRPAVLIIALAVPSFFLLTSAGASCCVGDCGDESSGPKTYDENGVTFQFPGNWKNGDHDSPGSATRLWSDIVGRDDQRIILVQAYRLNRPITARQVDEAQRALDTEARQTLADDEGQVSAGPKRLTVGGFPAMQYEGTSKVDGGRAESTWTFIFNGDTQYFINCSFEPTGSDDPGRREEVKQACQQVLDTFEAT